MQQILTHIVHIGLSVCVVSLSWFALKFHRELKKARFKAARNHDDLVDLVGWVQDIERAETADERRAILSNPPPWD